MKLKTQQKVILTIILASSVALSGCNPSNDTNTNTTTNTLVSSIAPTGTIQGNLIDAVTQQPIVGAVIDIGVATATTNQDGQFVLTNVPATQKTVTVTGTGTGLTGNYEVSINLKGVTSPVNMADPTIVKRYPDFSFKTATVEYISDISHPLTGTVKGYQFTVGKQAATVVGTVTDVKGQPVAAGYNVTLYSAVNAQNSATGNTGQGPVVTTTPAASNTGHIVGTTTTNASGQFTFANIEAGVPILIAAQDTANTMYGQQAITAPTENATRTLSFQNGDAVVVKSTDVTPPQVVTATPENNSDITPIANQTVAFTFSEPIKQTSVVADVSPSNPNGLYSLVDVNYTGPKPRASNLAHSLSWSADRKTLTVTLPAVGASSMYTVELTRAASSLKDDADNVVVTPATLAAAQLAKLAVAFTTNGGATVAAPTIAMTNSTNINATSLTTGVPVPATLDWLPVSGAKGYNVYRTTNEVWGTTVIAHQTSLINPVVVPVPPSTNTQPAILVSTFTDPFVGLDYVENNAVKLTYSYAVKAVNSDGIESAASNTVTAADVVSPALFPSFAVSCLAPTVATCDINGRVITITVPFDEKMDKASAVTAANYTITLDPLAVGTVPTVSSATYSTAGISATLTLSAPVATTDLPRVGITTGANGIANTTAAVGDTQVIAVGNGLAGSICVRAGGAALVTAPAAGSDDVVVGTTITSGANGICQTTAVAPDIQALVVGNGSPNSLAITPGVTGIVLSTPQTGSDDQKIGTFVTVNTTATGVKDVAGNVIKTTGAHYQTNGKVN